MFRDLGVYRSQKLNPLADTSALFELTAASGDLPPPTHRPGRTGWPLEISMAIWRRATDNPSQISGNLPIYPFIVGDVGTRSLSEYERLLRVKTAIAEWNAVLELICAHSAAAVITAACVVAETAWRAIDGATAVGTTGTTRPIITNAPVRILALETLRYAIVPTTSVDLRTLTLALKTSSLVNRARVVSLAAVAQTTKAIEAASVAKTKLAPGALQVYVNYVSLAIEWYKHCNPNDMDAAQYKLFLLHKTTLVSGHMPTPTWATGETVTGTILAWTNSE